MSSRRTFLKTTAAAGAVAATAGANLFAAGNETIKVGLVGCGGRGTGAVRDILVAESKINGKNPKVEIVAVGDAFDRSPDGQRGTEVALKAFRSDNPKSKYFPFREQIKVTPETTFVGLDAYQKVLNAGVDLVILASPPGFRPLHLDAAVKAGKHIFCEKPVAVDATGARKVYALEEESKKRNIAIVAGTQRRHQKGYVETVKKIHGGAIGDVVSARCSWNGQGIWFRDRAPGASDAAYQLNNWYHFLWACGDHIVEQHVHNLDVINWVMNDHPVRAVGMGGRATRPAGEPAAAGNIWDHYAVEYEYKNGVKMFSYCRHIPGDNDISETVFGAKGRCKVDKYLIGNEQVAEDDQDAYVQEHIDLLNSIRAGRPLNELRAVTDSTFTAILGRNASYACKALKWDDALKADEDLMPKNLAMDAKLAVAPAATPGAWKLPPAAG